MHAQFPSLRLAALATPEEFAQAAELRLRCYTERGKATLSHAQSLEQSGASFGIFAGPRLVGAIRMFAPEAHDPLESVDLPLGHYPSDLPAKTDSIEISGLCVLAEFRNIDAFKLIYAAVHRFLVENNRAWIIISADEVLEKKYRFIGFRKTRHSYQKPESAFPNISIMVSNQKRFGIYGLHADPIRWNLFLRDISEQLTLEQKIRLHPVARVIFSVYRRFSLPSLLLEKAIRRKLIRA